jgi:hypothetical protein
MATATVKLKVNAPPAGVDNTQRRQIVEGVATLSTGGDYVAGGLPMTWVFTDSQGGAFIPEWSDAEPLWTEFKSLGGNVGQTYLYEAGDADGAGFLHIAVDGTELDGAVAIPADIVGFRVEYARGY